MAVPRQHELHRPDGLLAAEHRLQVTLLPLLQVSGAGRDSTVATLAWATRVAGDTGTALANSTLFVRNTRPVCVGSKIIARNFRVVPPPLKLRWLLTPPQPPLAKSALYIVLASAAAVCSP